MNISEFFIDRPKFAFVISVVMVLAGLLSIQGLPVAEYPEIAPPMVQVRAMYIGATAQDIVDSVAAPIEAEMNGLENLLYYSSTCDNTGLYSLQIYFHYGTDSNIAQVNTQNAVKRAEPKLPMEVKAFGIHVQKSSSDILAMIAFTAESEDDISLLELSNYVKMNVRDPVARVDGISDVNIFSPQDYSMRAWLDTQFMSAMGISTAEVVQAIQGQNIQAAAGSIGLENSNDYVQLKIDVRGRLRTVEEFQDIIIRSDGRGNTVKLRDIAKVELGSEKYSGFSKINGKQAIVMAVFRNTDANAMDTVNAAIAELDRLSKHFPKGVRYDVGFNPTEFIKIAMHEIVFTLVLVVGLVVAVTYLFLQDWRATIIPTIAIPVSLLGTFPFLWLFGFSINTLSMFGLILVIGSLVDDAIIVVENVMTHIENGMDPKEATRKGMRQITGAVIAMTMVSVAIYVPICFYGGMVGKIYLQFAVTMSVAISLSAVNALTLSPALCAMILRKHKESKVAKAVFAPFNITLAAYKSVFTFFSGIFARRVILTAAIFILIFAANGVLYLITPTSFIPAEDKGALFCMVELPPGATQTRTARVMDTIDHRLRTLDGVHTVITVTGFGMNAGEGENLGFVVVKLSPWSERTAPELQITEIQKKVDKVLSDIPEAMIRCFAPPPIMGLGNSGSTEFFVCTPGEEDPQVLDANAKQFTGTLMNLIPNEEDAVYPTIFAMTTYNANSPLLNLRIDREKAETMGVPISAIFGTLQSKLASAYVNDFNISGYNFKVKIQSDAADRGIIEDIANLNVPNIRGEMVPFSALGDVEYMVGPRKISRFNQKMAFDMMAMGVPGVVSSGQYMDMIESVKLPEGYQIEWTGMSLQEKKNQGQILFLLVLSITFGYLFLVAQYESWMIPIPVIISVAVASLGALLGIKFCGLNLSIYAQLGLLMLIGIASKNAILMVEFAQVERESGKNIVEAAISGGRQRFRAVQMTAWAFILGVLPLAIATGAGAGSRQAIGVTTLFGMLLATVIGIVFIPGIYAIFERTREFFQPRLRRKFEEGQQ